MFILPTLNDLKERLQAMEGPISENVQFIRGHRYGCACKLCLLDNMYWALVGYINRETQFKELGYHPMCYLNPIVGGEPLGPYSRLSDHKEMMPWEPAPITLPYTTIAQLERLQVAMRRRMKAIESRCIGHQQWSCICGACKLARELSMLSYILYHERQEGAHPFEWLDPDRHMIPVGPFSRLSDRVLFQPYNDFSF